ncbi:MAG TPA: hypothetical protein VH740_03895 [Vicinamibacterales bacterium]
MTVPGGSERWAELLRAREERARPGPNCPDPDQIWGAVTRELPLAEREAIIDHTIECGACAEAWRLAVECARDVVSTNARSSAGAWTATRWLGIAAAAAVIVAAAGIAVWFGRSGAPEFRQPDRDAPQSMLAPDAVLPRDRALLQWSAGPPGALYDVTVTTEDLAVITSIRGLDQAEYVLPKERLTGLGPNTRLLWRVVAELPDGRRLASPTFEVTVR